MADEGTYLLASPMLQAHALGGLVDAFARHSNMCPSDSGGLSRLDVYSLTKEADRHLERASCFSSPKTGWIRLEQIHGQPLELPYAADVKNNPTAYLSHVESTGWYCIALDQVAAPVSFWP